MALINCSECTKEISDKAASCPNCGHPIVVNKQSVDFKPIFSKIKKNKINGKNIATSIISVILGLLSALIGITLLIALVNFTHANIVMALFGLVFLLVAFYMVLNAVDILKGINSVNCPYCGQLTDVKWRDKYLKCYGCNNKSIKSGEHFKSIQDSQFVKGSAQDSQIKKGSAFNYVVSILIPIVGFILGAVLIGNGKDDGKACIILGVFSIILCSIIVYALI